MQSLYLGSVSLFYAKDRYNNPRLIEEVDETNKDEEYTCYVCGAKVRPRALDSECVARHFYHVAGSDCSTESVMHYWYKNIYLQAGDKFKLLIDGKHTEYTCKEVLVEQTYTTITGDYRPDATVVTECGKKIFIEYDYTNKKKASEYIDRWTELDCTVVELNISKLKDWKEKVFKPVFHNGESLIDNSVECHSLIKKCLTEIEKRDRQRVKYLNWLLRDLQRYNTGEITIDELVVVIDSLTMVDKQCLVSMVKGLKCKDVLNEYAGYKFEIVKQILDEELGKHGIAELLTCGWIVELCYCRSKDYKFGGTMFNNTIKINYKNYDGKIVVAKIRKHEVLNLNTSAISRDIEEYVLHEVEKCKIRNVYKMKTQKSKHKEYINSKVADYLNSQNRECEIIFSATEHSILMQNNRYGLRRYTYPFNESEYLNYKGIKRMGVVNKYMHEEINEFRSIVVIISMLIDDNSVNNIKRRVSDYFALNDESISVDINNEYVEILMGNVAMARIYHSYIASKFKNREPSMNQLIDIIISQIEDNVCTPIFNEGFEQIFEINNYGSYWDSEGDIRKYTYVLNNKIYKISITKKEYASKKTTKIIDVLADIENMSITMVRYGSKNKIKFNNYFQMRYILQYIEDLAVEIYK